MGSFAAAVDEVAGALAGRARDGADVTVAAIDGRSGAGKSTLAAAVGVRTGALVIDGDAFYAGGTPEEWDARSAREKVELVIDWPRQRAVLEALRSGQEACWYPYDWEAFDGRLASTLLRGGPSELVILDGAYSARPELSDLLDLRVLLDPPDDVRRMRLLRREGDDYRTEWEARWTEAERHYFGTIVPRAGFDLVLSP